MPADVPEEAAAARGTLVPHIQRRRRVQHCAEHLARDGGREGWRLRLRCGLRRGLLWWAPSGRCGSIDASRRHGGTGFDGALYPNLRGAQESVTQRKGRLLNPVV
jgi:hypothetical protein